MNVVFHSNLPLILCAGAICRVNFLNLFGPIAGATNSITWQSMMNTNTCVANELTAHNWQK